MTKENKMIAEVKFKVGAAEYNIKLDDPKEMELLHKMIVIGNPPAYCNECKNNEYFKLDANKDKEGNIYINVMCTKCGAKAKLGQYKTGSYFWHKFETYIPKDGSQRAPLADPVNQEEPPLPTDVPF